MRAGLLIPILVLAPLAALLGQRETSLQSADLARLMAPRVYQDTLLGRTLENPQGTHRFCLRPKPAAGCDWFPITEFGAGVHVAGSGNDAGTEVIWQVGLAHQLSPRYALGAMVAVTTAGSDVVHITLAPRGRVLLGRLITLDVAPGLIVQGRQGRQFAPQQPSPDLLIYSSASGHAPGFALDASVSVGDWGAAFLRTTVFGYREVVRSPVLQTVLPGIGPAMLSLEPETVNLGGTIIVQRIGVRAGSYPGMILGVLATAVAIGLVSSGVLSND